MKPVYIYKGYDFDKSESINMSNLTNKLFCTFVSRDEIDETLDRIESLYTILYNKIFILSVKGTDEYIITYNVDPGNVSMIPENTILVHRKKDTNTLYSINALNELIKSLNEGYLDSSYRVNWNDYRNTILITKEGELCELKTKIYKILEV